MNQERRAGKGPSGVLRSHRRCIILTATVLLGAFPLAELAAQVQSPNTPLDERDLPSWVGQFTVLGANAVVGGLTAGVGQKLRGGSFADGFTRGFLGGTVVYAGKRIAVEHFGGSGLLGRTVAATGASIVRNASESRPSLEHLILPLGPVRLYVDRGPSASVRAKLDINTLVMTGLALSERDLDLDLASSLSAGAPVFTARERLFDTTADTSRASGAMVGNVIFLSELPWRTANFERELFAHERVHVLQRDQIFATIAEPLGSHVVARTPLLPKIYRYFDIHVTDLLFLLLTVPFSDYYDRPWEMEAFHLMDR